MKTADLDYHLPPDAIADRPSPERGDSRLLLLRRADGLIAHHHIRDFPELLDSGDLVVRNRSRVLQARLMVRRSSGGSAELLLVDRNSEGHWNALAKPWARLRRGEVLRIGDVSLVIEAKEAPNQLTLSGPIEAAMEVGALPLPPYIRRPADAVDAIRYQTVYAREPGSVAAPTAGLHFNEAILERLRQRDIGVADVLLHVGPGTFLPIRTTSLEDHEMHEEAFAVLPEVESRVAATLDSDRRVVAIGTTTVRALESGSGAADAAGLRRTRLLIQPGFAFQRVSAMLTNFHQPRSTLLAMVYAFGGVEPVRAAYREALARGYRFLSYGDAMLIL